MNVSQSRLGGGGGSGVGATALTFKVYKRQLHWLMLLQPPIFSPAVMFMKNHRRNLAASFPFEAVSFLLHLLSLSFDVSISAVHWLCPGAVLCVL